jgi:tetratricopeptide (TPR) repeat protein
LSICPDNTSFKMILLTCYLRYEKYDTAFALLEAVLEKDPHNKKALYYKAFCFRAVNDPYNAVDCLTKILALVSKSSGSDTSVDDELLDGESFLLRVLEMRGLLLHEQKAYKFALQDFGRAVCIDSTRAGNFYFRGNCHSKLGNFELAITDFALAEECNFPDLPFLLMCKGVVLRLVGDNESAVAEFDRAISAIEASESKEKSTKILLCRVYLYKSLSIINLRLYDQALENLLKIEKAVDGTLGNPAASKHMSRLNSSHFVVPPGQSYEDIIDPSLRWLVSYHTALSFYMLKRYAESMNVSVSYRILSFFIEIGTLSVNNFVECCSAFAGAEKLSWFAS